MARSRNAQPEPGDNHILTDDDIAALQHYYANRIRSQQAKADEAKAKYDAERTEVNSLFSLVKGELQISRKEFEEVLALQDMTEAEFLNHEGKRHKRLERQGLPVGTQMALPLGDTVDDKLTAEADGKRAGLRADDPTPPEHVSPILHPDWMRGWHAGQEINIMRLGRAQEIIDARAAPAEDEIPEEEPPEFDPAKEARALKNSGFMDTSAPHEDEDDDSEHAERELAAAE